MQHSEVDPYKCYRLLFRCFVETPQASLKIKRQKRKIELENLIFKCFLKIYQRNHLAQVSFDTKLIASYSSARFWFYSIPLHSRWIPCSNLCFSNIARNISFGFPLSPYFCLLTSVSAQTIHLGWHHIDDFHCFRPMI